MSGLTAKQQRFVSEYLLDGNGARAAIAAGYGRAGARVRAHRLTRDNVAVQAEIRARQGKDSHRLQVDRQDVLAGLLAAFAMAKEMREPATMVAATRELGRLMGFYSPVRSEVAITAGVGSDDHQRFEAMSDAELMGLLAG